MTDPLAATGTTNPNRQVSVRQWNELLTAVAITPQMFGALGDSDATASTGNDDTLAIQAALDYMDAQGGGILFFPAGYYKITSYLTLCKNLRIVGEGKNASHIIGTHVGGGGANAAENVRNGSILYSSSPINGSTPTIISIEHIRLNLTNAANVGACFYDSAGSEWDVRNSALAGGKYGIVAEQSEVAHIDLCDIGGQLSGGANIYIVNGSSLTPGASPGFCNEITASRCNLDGSSAGTCIKDEGGLNHDFTRNNYNGATHHITLDGVVGVISGEFEAATSDCITVTGNSVTKIAGPSSFSVATGHSAITGSGAAGVLEVDGSPLFSGGGGTNAITGGDTFAAVWLYSYSNNTGVALKDLGAQYVDVDFNNGNGLSINGATFSIMNGTGSGGGALGLPSGATVKVNGNQVLTARQTKPASPTLTDVVNLLVTHGLWA